MRICRRNLNVATWIVAALVELTAGPAMGQLMGGNVYPINGIESPPASFGTIASAVTYMSGSGVAGTGEVVLELQSGYAGETAPITIPAITGLGAGLGLLFRPAAGYSVSTVVTVNANRCAIRITGSWITLDGRSGGAGSGRDWTIRSASNGPNRGETAVRIENSVNNVSHVAVRYCILECQAQTNASTGAVTLDGSSTRTMTDIVVEDNTIRSAGVGGPDPPLTGIATGTLSNAGNTGLVLRNNTIQDFAETGIFFTGGFPGVLIEGNDILHSQTVDDPHADFSGIYFASVNSSGAILSRNFVHDLQFTDLSGDAVGLNFEATNTVGSPVRAFNNRISLGEGLVSSQTSVWGIRDGTSSGALLDVEDNTVSLTGAPIGSSRSSAALRREVPSAIRIRGNIFHNSRSFQTPATGRHWAISTAGTTNLQAIGYNDYYADGVNGGVLGTTTGSGSGDKTTLALWQSAVPQDSASISQNPYFVDAGGSPPDLRLDSSLFTLLESGGVPISGIPGDFEGDLRQGSPGYAGSGTAPDIGADEGEYLRLFENDVRADSIAYPPPGSELAGGVDGVPSAFFDNVGSFDQENVPVRFRITGPAPSTTEVLNITAAADSLPAGGGSLAVDFADTFLGLSPGVYTTHAVAELPGDQRPGNDEVTSTFTVPAPLAGSYNVGAVEAAPFNTLTAALARLGFVGASGPVVFELVDASYGPYETFPLSIPAYEGGGSAGPLTIRPAPGVSASISGFSNTSILSIQASYVTIDGSNDGSPSRDLTVANSASTGSSVVIWSSGDHGSIRNLNVSGADITLAGIGFGGSFIGINSLGPVDGTVVVNCSIQNVDYGIYVGGIGPTAGVVVLENDMTEGPPNRIRVCGIFVRGASAPQISGNDVANIARTSNGSAIGISVGFPPGIDALFQSGLGSPGALILRNRVSSVTAVSPHSAIGIAVATSQSTVRIENNMVSGVTSPAGVRNLVAGIYLVPGAMGGNTSVYANSVSLTGERGSGGTNPSLALVDGQFFPTMTDVRDNILSNTQTSSSGGKSYVIGLQHSTYSRLTSDYNVLHGAGPQNRFSVVRSIIDSTQALPSLAAWQAGTGKDSSSVASDPLFVDAATDLHIDTAPGPPVSPAAGAGTILAGLTLDFDGEARGGPPDIGADEFTTYVLITSTSGNGSLSRDPDLASYNPGSTVSLTAAPDPGYGFTGWSGDAGGAANPLPVIMNSDRTIQASFLPLPLVSVADASVLEGNSGVDSLRFSAFLSDSFPVPVEVNFATSDGSASVANLDYQAASGTVAFSPGGSLAREVLVLVNGDPDFEANETMYLRLQAPANAGLGDSLGVGTILNDDAAPVLSAGDLIVTEGSNQMITPALVPVSVSSLGNHVVSVRYDLVPGTAQFSDFSGAMSGTLAFFPPGPLIRYVSTQVLADLNHEVDETYFLILSQPANAVIGDSQAVVTIVNDDGPPSIGVSNVYGNEGNSGTFPLGFTIILSAQSYETITVEVATTDGTARSADGDYVPITTPLTVTFQPNTMYSTVPVSRNGDLSVEPSEMFTLNLANPVNASIGDAQGVGAIIDDDGPPGVAAGSAFRAEGNAGTSILSVPIMLSATAGTGNVYWETQDGTATVADNDYAPATGSRVTFTGRPLEFADVLVFGDPKNEPDETLGVRLTSAFTAMIDSIGEGAIVNDDDTVPPAVSVVSPNGGEGWIIGSLQSILWTASDSIAVTTVDLDFSDDGGTTWQPLVSGLANAGNYPWTIPDAPTTMARIRATAYDDALNAGTDTSDGNFTIGTQAGAGSLGLVSHVGPAEPDPFADRTTIRFGLAQGGRASLRVFNVLGALVRTLRHEELSPGEHETVWDGRDSQGRRLPSGLYFVRLEAAGRKWTTTVRLIR